MTCHFCGDDLPCYCTTECLRCNHIGHEHYGDGRCRGTNYDTMVEEPCDAHPYQPREQP